MQAVIAPHEIVNDESVLLLQWLVKDGEKVEPGHHLVTIETSKATMDIEAPVAGYVRFDIPKGTEVKVGGVLCYITESPNETIPKTPNAPAKVPVTSSPDHSSPAPSTSTRFSRQAETLMTQHGLTKEQFTGRGLVTGEDVLKLVNGHKASAPQTPTVSLSTRVPVRMEELPRRKRMEAKYLLAGQNAASSLVSVICSTRGLKAAAQTHSALQGGPLPLILHEVARLLRKYPVFNAFYDDGKVQYYEAVNIGIAMDAERGLKVPVLTNADHRSIAEIRMEVENFVLSYLDDTLPVQALADGTFTVTDLSGEDVHSFVPLINQGQAAILGIGAEYFQPGHVDGFFNLMLAFDHRLTEGRIAAAFLKDLRDRLSSYERALRRSDEEPQCTRCLRTRSELAELNVPLLLGIQQAGETAPICGNCILGW
ncbi:MAG TPA: 2-oxo acid dehydrogenase subunit E2 [Candidatus Udaeobacter sp.]|nr:2-oxo acid dehydrogenase subunit E2 [Candidatus Udaeobacter sp.]